MQLFNYTPFEVTVHDVTGKNLTVRTTGKVLRVNVGWRDTEPLMIGDMMFPTRAKVYPQSDTIIKQVDHAIAECKEMAKGEDFRLLVSHVVFDYAAEDQYKYLITADTKNCYRDSSGRILSFLGFVTPSA